MKKLLTGILILFLCMSLGACAYFSDRPQPNEIKIQWNANGELGQTVVQAGYIKADSLDVYDAPGSKMVVGQLQKGDYVQILETQNGWGRIDGGWILLSQIGTYEESGLKPQNEATKPQNPGATEGEGDEEEEQLQTSDDSFLQGEWYQLSDNGDGTVDIFVVQFRKGYFYEELWTADLSNIDKNNLIPSGGFTYTYTVEGNTVSFYIYGDPEEEDGKYYGDETAKVSGKTLTLSGYGKFTKGDLDDAIAKIKKDYGQDDDVGDNSELVGTWYSIGSLISDNYTGDYLYIVMHDFRKDGRLYTAAYELYISEIENWKTMDIGEIEAQDNEYRVRGDVLQIVDGSSVEFSISGSKLKLGEDIAMSGTTFYKGSLKTAVSKAYDKYAPEDETEAATEPASDVIQ